MPHAAAPSVHLYFNGNCKQAFDYYKSVLGGEFETLMTYRDAPGDIPPPETNPDHVMYVSLPVGGGRIMGGDVPESFLYGYTLGNNFALTLNVEEKEEADRLFAALSEGGSMHMEMHDAFWGSYFGFCRDQFGVNWQINCGG